MLGADDGSEEVGCNVGALELGADVGAELVGTEDTGAVVGAGVVGSEVVGSEVAGAEEVGCRVHFSVSPKHTAKLAGQKARATLRGRSHTHTGLNSWVLHLWDCSAHNLIVENTASQPDTGRTEGREVSKAEMSGE